MRYLPCNYSMCNHGPIKKLVNSEQQCIMRYLQCNYYMYNHGPIKKLVNSLYSDNLIISISTGTHQHGKDTNN